MGASRWVKQGGEQSGPFTEAELRRMAADGRLRPEALLSTDCEEWVRAARFVGLFPASRPRDTPPPLPAATAVARPAVGNGAPNTNKAHAAKPATPRDRAAAADSPASATEVTGAVASPPANAAGVEGVSPASAELLPVEAPPVPDAPQDVAPPPQIAASLTSESSAADSLTILLPELPPLEPRIALDPGLTPRTRAMFAAAIGGVAIGFLGTCIAWSFGIGAKRDKPDPRPAASSTVFAARGKRSALPSSAGASPSRAPAADRTVAAAAAASDAVPQAVALATQPHVPTALAPSMPAAVAPVPPAGAALPAAAAPAVPAAKPPAANPAANNANNQNKVAGGAPGKAAGPPAANDQGRRRMLVLGNGGTPESEAAVEAALVWLAAHQLGDGGWSFDHTHGPCGARCPNPGGMIEARNAATAMALLPFLAAGYGHEEGPYKATVAAGLNYLMSHMGEDGSFWEPGGTMYSQGLATTALCDAYNLCRPRTEPETQPTAKRDPKAEKAARAEAARLAKAQRAALAALPAGKPPSGNAAQAGEAAALPEDPEQAAARSRQAQIAQLGAAAQVALDFIVAAQNPKTGGWRYMVGDEGDTSVVGWQLMALRAGLLAGLRVPQPTLTGASQFLDTVQIDDGAEYGYQNPLVGTPATTAIGLLARQTLGWNAAHPAMLRGAQVLATHGMSQDDMYFNFYADQVLRNLGGTLWEQWNPLMRDFLVHDQVKSGHAAGSWMFVGAEEHAEEAAQAGGRLYNTAMCTLILQVYYRHAPIYSRPTSYSRVAVVTRKPATGPGFASVASKGEAPAGSAAPKIAAVEPLGGAAGPQPAAPKMADAPRMADAAQADAPNAAKAGAPMMADPAKPAAPAAPAAPALAMVQPAGLPPKMPAAANMNPNANKNPNAGAAPGVPQGPPPAANDRGRRRMLVLGNGGTPDSERAVEMSLAWLAAHQLTDGSWSFDHSLGLCGGQCPNPGNLSDARNAATGMALLPFLAAGYSHEDGPYRMNVWAGLNYLITHMGDDGSLWEPGGTMYSQGIATTALCEAYNLCVDRPTSLNQPAAPAAAAGKRDPKAERAARLEAAKLAKAQRSTLIKKAEGKLPSPGPGNPAAGFKSAATDAAADNAQLRKLRTLQLGAAAQKALNFIVAAQNPRTGGWRYLVGEEGDTSVVGWQLMALKAGYLADLRVPPPTLAAASLFLDAVQFDDGAQYGYTNPMRGTAATTAIGLLARENLGWDAANRALQRGALLLATHGPSEDDMYFNFYADQVLRNVGGQLWQQWNPLLRDYLVRTQEKQGHATGSWMFVGVDRHAQHSTQLGGRLYNTALATLILQVYYRHDPVYSKPTTTTPRSAATQPAPPQPSIGKPSVGPVPGKTPEGGAIPPGAATAPDGPAIPNAPVGAPIPAAGPAAP